MAFPKRSSLLWDRITHIVANNPVIKANVKTLQLRNGSENDLVDWTQPGLPALRLTPVGRGGKWSAESQHDVLLGVEVELGITGTNAGELMDFWDAFQAVFFPGDNSVFNALYTNHQVHNITAIDPAFSAQLLKDNYKAQYAKGQILFKRHVNT